MPDAAADGFEFLRSVDRFTVSVSFQASSLRWSCQAGASYLQGSVSADTWTPTFVPRA